LEAKIQTSARWGMSDAMLALCLSDKIHGTDEAIKATAHRVQGMVAPSAMPVLSRIIRCGKQREFVRSFLAGL
jgi:hypothetical protein